MQINLNKRFKFLCKVNRLRCYVGFIMSSIKEKLVLFNGKIYLINQVNIVINKKSLNKRIILGYDNSVSPPTFGDFIYVAFIARILILLGKKVGFIITKGAYRDDWSCWSPGQCDAFVRNQGLILEKLCNKSKDLEVILTDLSLKNAILVYNSNCNVILFHKLMLNNIPIYTKGFNFINLLISKCSSNLNQMIFSLDNCFKEDEVITNSFGRYIAWHCRFSSEWGSDRNLSESDFISLYNYLKERFPGFSIVIISDLAGCSYYKIISDKYNLHCYYSKDYSDSFFGDCYLILNSSFYFQFKGGGIGTIPILSFLPYEIRCRIFHERFWSKTKATSWQTPDQKFIDSDKIDWLQV